MDDSSWVIEILININAGYVISTLPPPGANRSKIKKTCSSCPSSIATSSIIQFPVPIFQLVYMHVHV
ncbi:hypothetical protein EYC84_002456 [Monilinia fructicola]|uniref:Uncharacterized protein n=1 Tax=Monilinia fructicola TaxID=38448 RepID=A0A5M9JTA6_MONFR|nr:hypothetical protein EYC84_002456 [Monilinia fructicola]